MSHITIDAALAEQLRGAAGLVEVRDPSGKVVGHLLPEADPADWEAISPEISDEELSRCLNSKESGYTTAEILARLEEQ